MDRSLIGVDVSKDYLDAAARPSGQTRRFTNDASGIAELVAWARPLAPDRIVFESTGHYQKAAVGALLAAGLPAVVVNARQVRDFAKGLGLLAKTDTLDAGVLARFGEIVETTVRPLPAPDILEFQEIYDRRLQLVRMLAAEKNHRHAQTGGSKKVLRSIETLMRHLEKQIRDLEDRMNKFVENSETFRAKDEVLQSIPGVGPHVSRTLLAHLPELGTGSRQTISALVGLAPTTTTAERKSASDTSAEVAARFASGCTRLPSSPSATAPRSKPSTSDSRPEAKRPRSPSWPWRGSSWCWLTP